jgi:uncharacterized membrane protein YccF (DUF307 family)
MNTNKIERIAIITHDVIGLVTLILFLVFACLGNTHWMLFCGYWAGIASLEATIRNARRTR